MAVRRLYETAFDSTASPAEAESDPEDILETSRRLFSPEPNASFTRPSPATSRSSSDSERSMARRGIARSSPGLPLKRIFSPWTCGKETKESETPTESIPSHNPKEEKVTSKEENAEEESKIEKVESKEEKVDSKEEKGKTFSPSVEFKKLDVADENQNCTEVLLPASTSAKPRASTDVPCNEKGPEEPSLLLQMPSTTTASHSSRERRLHLNLGCPFQNNPIRDFENGDCSSTVTAFAPARASREDMKRSNFSDSADNSSRTNLWLDFSRAPKRPRRHLCLDINGLTDGEELEPTAQLMKQGWYHGSISRADAENLLRLMKKGSYLVRCSEKLKRQYLLSLKSSRGVMHVKIVQLPNGKYVIKQQTQTFDSIPQLIQYFSTHILNIHEMNVYLSHPVIEKLL